MIFLMDPEFWARLLGIVIIDLTLAGDNALVIALAGAAAAHGDLFLVTFGIGLSLPIVVWGSSLLAVLMNRFVWIIWVGGGILGYVAGEMILGDGSLAPFIDHAPPGVALLPLLPGAAIMALGWWFSTQNGRKKAPGRA